MTRVSFSVAIVPFLVACASTGGDDSERRYTGVIEKTMTVTRHVEPSKLLFAFGALGGLLYASASEGTPTNLYLVITKYNEVSVQTDDEFSIGDCVEVIPTAKSTALQSFAYGDARVARSDRCAAEGIQINPGSPSAK